MASLEWNCEEAVRILLVAVAALSGLTFRHYDTDAASALDIVILKAEKGAERLDGIGGSDVTVEVIYASGTKTAADLDTIAAALESGLYSSTGNIAALPFDFLCLEQTGTSLKRDDGKKVHKRTLSFPFIAKLT